MRTCVVCGQEFASAPKAGRPPVTCSPECQRAHHAAQTKESKARVARRKCPPDKHGKSTGYDNYKCTCAKCRQWARDSQRERRAAHRTEDTKPRRTTGRSVAKRTRRRKTQ